MWSVASHVRIGHELRPASFPRLDRLACLRGFGARGVPETRPRRLTRGDIRRHFLACGPVRKWTR